MDYTNKVLHVAYITPNYKKQDLESSAEHEQGEDHVPGVTSR